MKCSEKLLDLEVFTISQGMIATGLPRHQVSYYAKKLLASGELEKRTITIIGKKGREDLYYRK